MSAFKDIVRNDINVTFMNLDEFNDIHKVNGVDMNVLIDTNELIEREKKQSQIAEGLYAKQILIYVKQSDFGPLPPVGKLLTLDGRRYIITDSVAEMGVYSISLEANKS